MLLIHVYMAQRCQDIRGTMHWGSTSNGNSTFEILDGFPLTGSATQSSSPLGGSTSTVAAAGSPSFGGGSSPFSHGPFFLLSTSGSTFFGRAGISDEHRGSRIAPYATTAEVEGANFKQPTGKLSSLSAIPVYRDKSHEELRWEDYQLGDKGGSNPYSWLNFGSGGPCGASTVSAVGSSSIPGFESSSRPPFKASSTQSFSFGSASLFGQPTSKFDVNAVGTTFPYGTWSSHFGPQITASTFGCIGFGKLASNDQSGGSRKAAYAATVEVEGTNSKQPAGKLMSVSAISIYKNKSHEELRWEDYQLGDKGGSSPSCMPNFGSGGPYGASNVSACGSSSMLACGLSSTPAFRFGPTPSHGQSSNAFVGSSGGTNPSSYAAHHSHFGGPCPASQSVGTISFGASMTKSSLSDRPTFCLSAINPFSSSTSSNSPMMPAFAASVGPSLIPPFSSSTLNASYTTNPFGTVSSTSAIPSAFEAASHPKFETGTSPPLFGALSSSAFRPSSSILSLASAPGTSPTFTSGLIYYGTQPSPLFLSGPSLGHTNATIGQTASTLGQGTAPSLGQSNTSGITSTVLEQNVFLRMPPLHPKSEEPPLTSPHPKQAAQTDGVTNVLDQSTFDQLSTTQDAEVVQSSPVVNPFGTLGAMPQTSIAQDGSAVVKYGISSMPVADKTGPQIGSSLLKSQHFLRRQFELTRFSSLLTSGPLSKRQFRLQPRKYHPKNDDRKVPFFSDLKEMPCVPSRNLLPRENPRELIVGPTEQWPTRSEERPSLLKDPSTSVHNMGNAGVNIVDKKESSSFKPGDRSDGVLVVDSTEKTEADTPFPGQKADEARIGYDHSADVARLLPKLHHSDYYTEPTIQELAAKERGEPGFCRHVKDFLVGRHGYGCIKFSGETDIEGLDLESLVQFNNREVIVYMDESKKPPAGQGLNKAAEVTLFNIKCVDKRTGDQHMDGARVNNYRNMLMKAAKSQGAEHVSYDPIKGEWKFRVQHFS